MAFRLHKQRLYAVASLMLASCAQILLLVYGWRLTDNPIGHSQIECDGRFYSGDYLVVLCSGRTSDWYGIVYTGPFLAQLSQDNVTSFLTNKRVAANGKMRPSMKREVRRELEFSHPRLEDMRQENCNVFAIQSTGWPIRAVRQYYTAIAPASASSETLTFHRVSLSISYGVVAINILILFSILYVANMIVCIWRYVIAKVRRFPQGQCVSCGYSVGHLSRCPECGLICGAKGAP
jgi:hypothetical protein